MLTGVCKDTKRNVSLESTYFLLWLINKIAPPPFMASVSVLFRETATLPPGYHVLTAIAFF